MAGVTSPRTVCGLWVVNGIAEVDLSNYSWQTTVIDTPGDEDDWVAEEFVKVELMRQIGMSMDTQSMIMPDGVLCGPQHIGYLTRESYYYGDTDLLSLAKPWVSSEMIRQEYNIGPDDLRSYLVCGITQSRMDPLSGMEEGHQPVDWETTASNPLMAYYNAHTQVQAQTGLNMLLCAVHRL